MNWKASDIQKLKSKGRTKPSKTIGRPKLKVKYVKFVFFGIEFNLNKVIALAKKNPKAYAKYKKDQQKIISLQCIGLPSVEFIAKYKYTIYSKNKRQDGGNMLGVSKIVEDALQETGIIKNDNQDFVKSHEFIYEVDKLNPRIELEIIG